MTCGGGGNGAKGAFGSDQRRVVITRVSQM